MDEKTKISLWKAVEAINIYRVSQGKLKGHALSIPPPHTYTQNPLSASPGTKTSQRNQQASGGHHSCSQYMSR